MHVNPFVALLAAIALMGGTAVGVNHANRNQTTSLNTRIKALETLACGFYQYEDGSVDTESSDTARYGCMAKVNGYKLTRTYRD